MINSRKLGRYMAVGLLMMTGAAQATLINRGGGMIYDSAQNLTWLQDANAGAGSSFDNGRSATDGRMTWDSVTAWAASLTVGGFTDWRLPTPLNAGGSGLCGGYHCTGSELGHLFYTELGGRARSSILSASDPNGYLPLFSNVQPGTYWLGMEYAPLTGYAWFFNAAKGFQDVTLKRAGLFAWAVRSGDVAGVPEPATVLLMTLGLAGLGLAKRGRRQ